MSAILGIYNLDDTPVNRRDLVQMLEKLMHRGPDGAGIWQEGAIGLGHQMLWTTLESLLEELPMQRQAKVMTADARIDNREELIDTLELRGLPAEITDCDLILAAYEQWGEHCPEYLLGDFAFAIWDQAKQQLFCARDHFGVKPFYYYQSETTFIFASEIKAILCHPDVPATLNETRIADYLVPMFHDTRITSYQHILRLPPAHCCTVSSAQIQCDRYWQLDASHNIQFSSDEEYAQEFRKIFTEAVRCRLRSAFPIGSELSGGLDSSSITCVARTLLPEALHTFSAVFNELTECDERQYIEPILALGNVQSHYFVADQPDPLQSLDRVLWHQDEVFFAPNHAMGWGLNGVVRSTGVRVLLSGFDGDTTVSDGYGYLGDLAQAGQWRQFIAEAKPLTQTLNIALTKWLWSYFHHFTVKPIVNRFRVLRLAVKIWRKISQKTGRELTSHQAEAASLTDAWNSLVDPALMQKVGLEERYQDWQRSESKLGQPEREQHYKAITQGITAYALEVQDKDSAAFGFETRYPFWDKRLVEFCLAIPAGQKLKNGWNRSVLRRAMTGFLPIEVQWRRGKADFTANAIHGLLKQRSQLDQLIDQGSIPPYVNAFEFQKIYQTFLAQTSQTSARKIFQIQTVLSLSLWLQHINRTEPTAVQPLQKEVSSSKSA
jgi:asparagine synthase (glutamine-hydrolysing)